MYEVKTASAMGCVLILTDDLLLRGAASAVSVLLDVGLEMEDGLVAAAAAAAAAADEGA